MKNLFLILITFALFTGCKKEPVAEPEIKPIEITDPVKVEYIMKPKSAGGTLKSAITNYSEITLTDYIGLFNTIVRDEEKYISLNTITYKGVALTRQRPDKGTKIIFRGLQHMTGGNLIVSIDIDGKTFAYADVEPNTEGIAEFSLSYTF